jgi:hypothetical protein
LRYYLFAAAMVPFLAWSAFSDPWGDLEWAKFTLTLYALVIFFGSLVKGVFIRHPEFRL